MRGSWWKQAMCGQDRNYTRIGNVFNVSYLSIYVSSKALQIKFLVSFSMGKCSPGAGFR